MVSQKASGIICNRVASWNLIEILDLRYRNTGRPGNEDVEDIERGDKQTQEVIAA